MKHVYSSLLLVAFTAFGLNASAQCTSCTTTVTGADAGNHIITSGTTLCVSPTGSLSGLITIQSGGVLCNQGVINSSNVWVDGGTLRSYGTINSHNILVSNAGEFTNESNAMIDSLLVSESSSQFVNHGTLSGVRLGTNAGAVSFNSGSITCDYVGDSLGTLTNYGSLTVHNDLYNAYTSVIHTNSSNSYMKISGNFYNSTSSVFTLGTCMIEVGGSWYNSATIDGPIASSGCGGFNIAGLSLNSGTVGATGEHIDLCDAGHPSTGIDGNSGTIVSGTTYCTCMNICSTVGITEIKASEDVQIRNVYPNPAVTNMNVELNVKTEGTVMVEMYTMTGKKAGSTSLHAIPGMNKLTVDVSGYAAGTYVLNVTDGKGLKAAELISVTK